VSHEALRLFGNRKSANTYKVELLLRQLGRDFEYVNIDLGPNSKSDTPEYRRINPLGQIPSLGIGGDRYITQSAAILCYLAQGSKFLPSSAYDQALVMQWLFFEQYEIEPNVGWARWICQIAKTADRMSSELERYRDRGGRALAILDGKLACSSFVVGNEYSIADAALYAYTHLAGEGGLALGHLRNVCSWLRRIEELPGYLPMPGPN
jgi:glutathione S-transferase